SWARWSSRPSRRGRRPRTVIPGSTGRRRRSCLIRPGAAPGCARSGGGRRARSEARCFRRRSPRILRFLRSIREGMAWWYRDYAPEDAELARLEAAAKAERRALWDRPNPTPPWKRRKESGVPAAAGVVGNRSSHAYHSPTCRSVAIIKESNHVTFATAE